MKMISGIVIADATKEAIRQRAVEILRKAELYCAGFMLSVERKADNAREGVFDMEDGSIGIALSIMDMENRQQCGYRCTLTPLVKELKREGFLVIYDRVKSVVGGTPARIVEKNKNNGDAKGTPPDVVEWTDERLAKALTALQGYDPWKRKPTDMIIRALQLDNAVMPRVRQMLRRWVKEGLIARRTHGYTVIYAVTVKGQDIIDKHKSE